MCEGPEFLDMKIDKQLDFIVENMDRIQIQIIIEGYISLFDKLKTKLDKSSKNYAIV